MSKQRVVAIEYIRGISMLGVLGIHTGAYSLMNPAVNVHLFALLEIVSRFSVPVFFFVSAFGLFWGSDGRPFHYGEFLLRRGRSVLLPYLAWSLLYMGHYTWTTGDVTFWQTPKIYEVFLFGLTQYQLYWLVLLMVFYLLMPLWRWLLVRIEAAPILWFAGLFLFQEAFNYYSCYVFRAGTGEDWLSLLGKHRLNYVVFHYVLIFLLGGWFARHWWRVLPLLEQMRHAVIALFGASLLGMLGWYYKLLEQGKGPEGAVGLVHQLSPIGVVYTVAAALFFCWWLSRPGLSPALKQLLGRLGGWSYGIYLCHPFVMYYLVQAIEDNRITMDVPVVIGFYLSALVGSILLVRGIEWLSGYLPIAGICLLGAAGKTRKNS